MLGNTAAFLADPLRVKTPPKRQPSPIASPEKPHSHQPSLEKKGGTATPSQKPMGPPQPPTKAQDEDDEELDDEGGDDEEDAEESEEDEEEEEEEEKPPAKSKKPQKKSKDAKKKKTVNKKKVKAEPEDDDKEENAEEADELDEDDEEELRVDEELDNEIIAFQKSKNPKYTFSKGFHLDTASRNRKRIELRRLHKQKKEKTYVDATQEKLCLGGNVLSLMSAFFDFGFDETGEEMEKLVGESALEQPLTDAYRAYTSPPVTDPWEQIGTKVANRLMKKKMPDMLRRIAPKRSNTQQQQQHSEQKSHPSTPHSVASTPTNAVAPKTPGSTISRYYYPQPASAPPATIAHKTPQPSRPRRQNESKRTAPSQQPQEEKKQQPVVDATPNPPERKEPVIPPKTPIVARTPAALMQPPQTPLPPPMVASSTYRIQGPADRSEMKNIAAIHRAVPHIGRVMSGLRSG